MNLKLNSALKVDISQTSAQLCARINIQNKALIKRPILSMTKKIFHLAFLLTLAFAATTQAQNHAKFNFSAGLGLVPTFVADNADVNTPPISFRAGYQFTPTFSLSAFAGYSNSTSATPYLVTDGQLAVRNNKQFLTGLRAEFRRDFEGKFDVYGGGMLGVNRTNTTETNYQTGTSIVREPGAPTPFDPNAPKSQLLYSGFVGGTYYVAKNMGVFAEVGYGVSLLNAGFTVRI